MKPTPPHIALKFLRWFCREDYLDEVEGDLVEIFEGQHEESPSAARRKFIWTVVRHFRPEFIKAFKLGQNSNTATMFQHNLKLTYRNFAKHRSQFLINLTGLSTGIACTLFIYLWVTDELSVDKYHEKVDRMYQVMSNHSDASGIFTWKGVPGLLQDEVVSTIPEIEHSAVFTDAHEYTLSVDESFFKADGKFANPDFFDVFSHKVIKGSTGQLLKDKSSVVISESLAQRLFGTTDAIGKMIVFHFWNLKKEVYVSGIIANIPPNSSEQFDFVMSWDYYHDDLVSFKNWFNYYARIVVALNPGSDVMTVERKIDSILKEKQQDDAVTLFLANYGDRYLYNKFENGEQAGGRIEYIRIFTVVALFILCIACINFINLSTAKASHRTKEIGIKKSVGASRGSLITQYLTESVLLSLIATFIAVGMVHLLLPKFNLLSQKQLEFHLTAEFIAGIVSILLIVGLIAGSYPAIFLSGFKPVQILKGTVVRSATELNGRKLLVIFQFTLSIILIVAVVVVYQQMDYLKNKNLGYDRDNVVYIEREGALLKNSTDFIHELKTLSGISEAALSGFMVGGGNSTGGVDWEGKTEEDQIQFWETKAGPGMTELLGLEIVEGRTFSEDFATDSVGILFNETAIKAMGMVDPIGQTIRHYNGDRKIIGVVKDFNLISLHTPIEPMLFLYEPKETHFVMAKLKPGNEKEALEAVEDLFKKFNPGYVFKPQFLDQDYQALYAAEERVDVLSRIFSGLAILISCLGLFGLAAFNAERRTKEIAIRKILGAGLTNLSLLLSADFTKMVGVAIVIALPISYYLVRQWLSDFAFRIALEWWYFAGAGLIALLIAWFTISLQTIKASQINPINCLKDE